MAEQQRASEDRVVEAAEGQASCQGRPGVPVNASLHQVRQFHDDQRSVLTGTHTKKSRDGDANSPGLACLPSAAVASFQTGWRALHRLQASAVAVRRIEACPGLACPGLAFPDDDFHRHNTSWRLFTILITGQALRYTIHPCIASSSQPDMPCTPGFALAAACFPSSLAAHTRFGWQSRGY